MKKIFFYPCLFILVLLYAVKFNDVDFDFWARIAVGKMFFQTGNVLPFDIFSYTITKPWIDHEWGSGVIFYFFLDHFGDAGLIGLKTALMFTIMFLISQIIKLQNPKPDAHLNILFYLFVILGAFYGICHTIRCQLFTFTFFTLWIYALERVRRGETRLLWILPATMLVWANLHGGFVAGIGLLLMYGVGEFLNRKPCLKYFLTVIPVSLVTLINPYGIKYLQYIIFATTMDRSNIGEWQMTDLFTSWNKWYSLKIIILIAIIGIIFYFVKNRPKFHEIDKVRFIILGVTSYLAISHIKHQAFFVITAASFFYHNFYGIFQEAGNFLKVKKGEIVYKILNGLDLAKNAVIYTLIIISGILFIKFQPIFVNLAINKFPVGSVEFVRQNNLKGNTLTVFEWGSYAAWKLYPNCLIALDGRYEEVYPEKTFLYVGFLMSYLNSPEHNIRWDYVLDKYHTDIIIIGTQSEKKKQAYKALTEKPEWKMVYEDLISAVFIRKKDFKDNYIKPKLYPHKVIKEKYYNNVDFLF
ncbi:MAG TPA: hypothetical protein P5556_09250 [Candidatus Gastranaerophilales bacterium]|nr:hypothetical protein [Candidatus Gastranaerophilales bacterium]